MSAIWAILIYLAATYDGVRHIPGAGKGLFEHYGFLTCFIAGPLVLLNTYYAVSYFLRLMRDIEQFLVPGADPATALAITQAHVHSILLRGRWRFMLALFCIIGIGISLVIFAPLDHPERYWGNDVFNAEAYRASWLAANAYLLVLWGLIYPLGLFYVFHIAISAQLVVTTLKRENLLQLDFLHVDRCGGMAKFGAMNLIIMLIYIWMALAIGPLYMTHENDYPSLAIGFFAFWALLIFHSIFGIVWVARAIKAQRDETVSALNLRIRELMGRKQRSFAPAIAAMEYRDRVLGVASYPYSGGVLIAVNSIRFVPGVVVIGQLTLKGLTIV